MSKVAIITSRFDITKKQLEGFRDFLPSFDKDKDSFLVGGEDADYDIYLTLVGQGFSVDLYPRSGNGDNSERFNGAKSINGPLPLRDRNKKMIDDSTIVISAPQTFNEYEDSPAWKTIRYAMQSEKEIYVISPNGHCWSLR